MYPQPLIAVADVEKPASGIKQYLVLKADMVAENMKIVV